MTLDQVSDAIQYARLIGRLLDSAGVKYDTGFIFRSLAEFEILVAGNIVTDNNDCPFRIEISPTASVVSVTSVWVTSGRQREHRFPMDSYGLLRIKELISEWKLGK